MAYFWTTTSSMTPWDDQENRPVNYSTSTTSSNTLLANNFLNNFRQGAELKTTADFFRSTQPKLWGGELKPNGTITHEQNVGVYGQAVPFTEYFNDPKFDDKGKFDPVGYITLGENYDFPIYLNGGPQENDEAFIDILPYGTRKLPEIESNNDKAKGVKGEFGEGNTENGRNKGQTPFSYFIPYYPSSVISPWLDEGEKIFGIQGSSISGAIKIPGYISTAVPQILPFKDAEEKEIILSNILTNASNSSMTGSMLNSGMEYKFDEDIRPLEHRSVVCGFSYYGPNASLTGTDSIAFGGWMRGS